MVSKREQKKWMKFLQHQGRIMDLELTDLLIQEVKFDRWVRNKGLRLSKKREKRGLGYVG